MINKLLFMEENLVITSKGGLSPERKSELIIPLKPNRTQLEYLSRRGARNVILKPRQLGTSTIILADFFIDVITIEGIAATVVSHAEQPTQKLLAKVKLFYHGCPKKNFFPRIRHDSENLLSFPLLNSSFYIGTARAKALGKGETIHRCLLSEFPMYDIGSPGRRPGNGL